jgi:transposase-like protein
VRSSIIRRILEEGQPMREVAAAMGVNISTCKAIIKVYQEEGRIGKKQKRNKVVNVVETFSFFCLNDGQVEQVEQVRLEESKLSLKRN